MNRLRRHRALQRDGYPVRTQGEVRGTRAPRRGLTLIEVLVVVFILGILAALILPAIHRARVAARRAQCSSRLRQLSHAMTVYHDTHSMYPFGSPFSPHGALLPQLGYEPLYNAINFSREPYVGSNGKLVASTRVEIFRCPSDYPPPPWGAGGTNYVGNSGRGARWFGEDFNDDGAFTAYKRTGHSAAMFRDGLAYTVAFSESVSRPTTVNPPILPANPQNRELFLESCQALPQVVTTLGKGGNWLQGELYHALYNHMIGPNRHSCKNGGLGNTMAYTATSRHSGGVNLTMMDSSTRFISENIDIGTWRALSTRAGGEVIQDF